jgi:hypothetical protein
MANQGVDKASVRADDPAIASTVNPPREPKGGEIQAVDRL